MRRILSISLLLLFTLPLISPLFAASTADMSVPACCRRNGKHHCMMTAALAQHPSSGADKVAPASVQESCSCNLSTPATINLPFDPDQTQAAAFADSVSSAIHPSQADVSLQLLVDCSNPKRGPPSLNLSHS